MKLLKAFLDNKINPKIASKNNNDQLTKISTGEFPISTLSHAYVALNNSPIDV